MACGPTMKQFLLTRGRAFVYSTALPVPVVAAASAALQVSTTQPQHRHALWARIRQLGDALGRRLHSPIAALVIGDATEALLISRRLLQVGSPPP